MNYLVFFTPPKQVLEFFNSQEKFLHCTLFYFQANPSQESNIKDIVLTINNRNDTYFSSFDRFDVFKYKKEVVVINSSDLYHLHNEVIVDIAKIDMKIFNNQYFGKNYKPHISFRSMLSVSKRMTLLSQFFEFNKLSCIRIGKNKKSLII